ncbi:hypothetical protein GQ55_1G149000 [Panicum hallii var. hallii]|uniref:Uncharacterized protein n=1 Tax=Panicum hallii var. hallii TaxID=1504633 RepID=A0A2T7F5D5_9POAL|nr:hypothetical protein GQ55_1G149000 [Panicum hallii var. hallii]
MQGHNMRSRRGCKSWRMQMQPTSSWRMEKGKLKLVILRLRLSLSPPLGLRRLSREEVMVAILLASKMQECKCMCGVWS